MGNVFVLLWVFGGKINVQGASLTESCLFGSFVSPGQPAGVVHGADGEHRADTQVHHCHIWDE